MLGKRRKEAAFWVARLEKAEPGSFRTTQTKARVLKELNREQEAVNLLQTYASKHANQARLVAKELEDLGRVDEASQFYLAASRSGLPEDALAQAGFLSRQGRLSEALNILENLWKKEDSNTVQIAEVALTFLYADVSSPDREQTERIARLLEASYHEGNRIQALVFQLANVRILQQRYAEAISLLRESTGQENGTGALNNLAWLLALHDGKPAEALTFVNQAIEQEGPVRELLDTRSVIYLISNRPELAREDSLGAIAQASDATLYFHLALACLKTGDRKAAADAMKKAREKGFTHDTIHPLEQKAFKEQIRELAQL